MDTNQTRKRPGWLPNFFDLAIIAVVILAAVLFLWWRGAIGGTGGSGDQNQISSGNRTLRYTIELSQMYGDSANLIQVGDKIVDGVRKYEMGTVVSVEVGDSITYVHDMEHASYRPVVFPGYQTATLVLEAECSETDTELTVGGGYLIRCGTAIQVRGPGYAGSGTILSIERGNQQ